MHKSIATAAVVAMFFATTACGSGMKSSASGSATDNEPSKANIDVNLSDYMIMPHSLTAPVGTVTFKVKNSGQDKHNFTIKSSGGKVVAGTRDLTPGASQDLKVKLAAGTLDTLCTVPGHASLGMKGDLKVS